MSDPANTVTVDVLVSSESETDEAYDLVLNEVAALRAELTAHTGIIGPVSLRPDQSDPGRQGGELLTFAMAMVPPLLETVLLLIKTRRERRAELAKSAEAASLSLRIRLTGPGGVAELDVDGTGRDVLPTATELLEQLGRSELSRRAEPMSQ